LRWQLKHSRNLQVYKRVAALLAVHQGQPVGKIAELLGVTRQCIYNWIAVYGQSERPMDLADAPRSGRPSLWTGPLQSFLQDILRQGPASCGYSASNWTLELLLKHLKLHQDCRLSAETLRKGLQRLGYVTKRGCYHLCTDPPAARGSARSVQVPPQVSVAG